MIINEFTNLYKFFHKTPADEKAVVFYAEHAGYYPYFEGIIKELTESHKLTVTYITSDPKDPILQSPPKNLKPVFLKHTFFILMTMLDCKILVMTMTDLDNLHIKKSVNPVHYVYAFHSPLSTHMSYPPESFDHYDSILCTGEYQLNEIRKRELIQGLKPKNLIKAGYYRLERINRAYATLYNKTKEKTVLIAPSWGDRNILSVYGIELTELLLKSGYKVIVRPHPETMHKQKNMLAKLKHKFDYCSDFYLEESISTDESLLKADILISNYSGVAIEYALGTERPVLFIDIPKKVKNTHYKILELEPLELSIRDKIGIVLPSPLDSKGCPLPEAKKNIADVPHHINLLLEKSKEYAKNIRNLRDNIFFNFGSSSKAGADYIINLLKEPPIYQTEKISKENLLNENQF